MILDERKDERQRERMDKKRHSLDDAISPGEFARSFDKTECWTKWACGNSSRLVLSRYNRTNLLDSFTIIFYYNIYSGLYIRYFYNACYNFDYKIFNNNLQSRLIKIIAWSSIRLTKGRYREESSTSTSANVDDKDDNDNDVNDNEWLLHDDVRYIHVNS